LEDGTLATWSIVTLNGTRATKYYAASLNATMRNYVTDRLSFFECCSLADLGMRAYDLMGIGNDFPRGGQIDWVLGQYSEDDLKVLQPRFELVGDVIKSFVLAGIDITMNQYNKLGKSVPRPSQEETAKAEDPSSK
jgi:hypothetical protein